MGLFLPGVIGHRWLEGHRRSVLWSLLRTPGVRAFSAHPHLFLAGPASFCTIQGPSSGLAGAQKVWQRSQVETWGGGVGEESEGIRGGLTLMSSCWSGPRMGQPIRDSGRAKPRVMVGREIQRHGLQRAQWSRGPERERLAVIQRHRERKLSEREPQRIPGTETQRKLRDNKREESRRDKEAERPRQRWKTETKRNKT